MANIALPDLDKRSVLDVVEENFKAVNLKTYAIRMVYIGEHALSKDEIIEHFKGSIKDVNSKYCEINVSGLLLVYDSYFVHIVEGSEDTVHRHLRFLFQREVDWVKKMEKLDAEALEEVDEEGISFDRLSPKDKRPERKFFRRLKIVIIYHSVKTLLFKDWRALTARPLSLVGKLVDVHGTLQDHFAQLHICIDKINKICAFATANDQLSFEGLSAVDPKMEALPEVILLDLLLQSPYLLDLRETAALHRRVDDFKFFFEEVWPLQTHFTPRLLYKLKIDDSFVEPLPVMPWEIVKKETEDEEARDDRSASSED